MLKDDAKFMDPGAKPGTAIREDGTIEMPHGPTMHDLNTPYDPMGLESGMQGHPGKPKQTRQMRFFGEFLE